MTPNEAAPWWSLPACRQDLEAALRNVLDASMSRSEVEPLFRALNCLMDGFLTAHATDATDVDGLCLVLNCLAPADQKWLVNRDSVAGLAHFSPSIESGYRRHRDQPTLRHEDFREAFEEMRSQPDGNSRRVILDSLGRLLWVVRSNLSHHGKSIRGPDAVTVERDRQVVVATLPVLRDTLEVILNYPSRRLACYGSLRPGEKYEGVLSDLNGRWRDGYVMGDVTHWNGYPRLRWSNLGEQIQVCLFESEELDSAWDRIDGFEGQRYVRSLVPVFVDETILVASCYLADS